MDEAEVVSLAVEASGRRKGIGRALLEQVLQRWRAEGVRHVYLEVKSTNQPARALYEACGFTEYGTRRAYYRDGTDAVLYRRTLDPPEFASTAVSG